MPRVDLRRAFPATLERGGGYHPRLRALARRPHSGVYVILDRRTRDVLYVGESHTGRLFDTLTRHFRAWSRNPSRDSLGRRYGGTTYDRDRVAVAWRETSDDDAQDAQLDEIERLEPRDNVNGWPDEDDAGSVPY